MLDQDGMYVQLCVAQNVTEACEIQKALMDTTNDDGMHVQDACCYCGGGAPPESFPNYVFEWELEVYGYYEDDEEPPIKTDDGNDKNDPSSTTSSSSSSSDEPVVVAEEDDGTAPSPVAADPAYTPPPGYTETSSATSPRSRYLLLESATAV